MKRYSVYVGLGSNKGDRAAFLQAAATRLRYLPETTVVQHSAVYESDPYGNKDQARFLNAVTEIDTALNPGQLFSHLKEVESSLGRHSLERWGPREIDLDILVYDGLVYDHEELHVPHSDMANRKFVLIPLREIAPDLVHPENGMTIEELVAVCPDSGRVVKTSFRLPL